MNQILLNDVARLDYRAAAKWLLSLHFNDLYDFVLFYLLF